MKDNTYDLGGWHKREQTVLLPFLNSIHSAAGLSFTNEPSEETVFFTILYPCAEYVMFHRYIENGVFIYGVAAGTHHSDTLRHEIETNDIGEALRHVSDCVCSIERLSGLYKVDELPESQMKVLVHHALGYSIQQTAHKLGIKESTVRTYRERLFKRFEVNSMAQATVVAIQRHILTPYNLIVD